MQFKKDLHSYNSADPEQQLAKNDRHTTVYCTLPEGGHLNLKTTKPPMG